MELGSEYNLSLSELNIVEDNIFSYLSEYRFLHCFDSGRNAIRCLSRHIDHKMKILMPEFICESVTDCFDKEQIVFYALKEDFSVDVDDLSTKMGSEPCILFLMHYFGALQPQDVLDGIRELADKTGTFIIEDTTHSIFTAKKTIGDYMLCSIRKWMPIAGGGVLYYNDDKLGLKVTDHPKSDNNLRTYGMILKDLFLKERLDCNSEYRAIFEESESALDRQEEIFMISDLSKFIATCVSVSGLRTIRRRNYKLLEDKLSEMGVRPAIVSGPDDTPLVFPIRVHERDSLRKYLMDNRIYCAVHWPFDGFCPDERPFAVRNSKELISLPIDQRYDTSHIEYMIDVLKRFGGDLSF